LETAINSLKQDDEPEIIFAESVGSCTDIIATIVNPLMKFRPEIEINVSIFVDAGLLLQQLSDDSKPFEEEVQYIFNLQLAEADVLVVNKIDLLVPSKLATLKEYLDNRYPQKEILYQNSLDTESIRKWINCMNNFVAASKRKTLEIDYNIYGAGEAKLAWLNEEVEIRTTDNKAVEAAVTLIDKIHAGIKSASHTIGHLKFLIDDGQTKRKISFVSFQQKVFGNDPVNSDSNTVFLLINARVQTEPLILKQILKESILELKQETACKVIERKGLAFKPGFPKPTHRIIS
jgi:G3E family GTPase